jgi:hypothetical protein
MSNKNPPKNNVDDESVTEVPDLEVNWHRRVQRRRFLNQRAIRRPRNTRRIRQAGVTLTVTPPTLVDLYVGSHVGAPIHTDGSKDDPVTLSIEAAPTHKDDPLLPLLVDLYTGSHYQVPIHTDGTDDDPVTLTGYDGVDQHTDASNDDDHGGKDADKDDHQGTATGFKMYMSRHHCQQSPKSAH